MVREIIKNAHDPVKNRAIPQQVIDKYVVKVKAFQADVARVMEEEKAEREIVSLENKTNRLQKQLEDQKQGKEASPERAWFQKRDEKKTTKSKRKKKNVIRFDNEEDQKLFQEGEYLTRENKRARKLKKIRAVVESEEPIKKGKNHSGKRKSAFEDDITNVQKKNVKRLRHEGNVRGKNKKNRQR